MACICCLQPCLQALAEQENVESAETRAVDLGSGIAEAEIRLPQHLFYDTLSQRSGLTVEDDGDLMQMISDPPPPSGNTTNSLRRCKPPATRVTAF